MCDVERMYSGETSSYITARTETTRLINCATDPTNCPYERSRWVKTDDTICDGKDLCSVLAEEISSDGFVWHRSGKIKLGAVISENDDKVCGATPLEKYGKWEQIDGYLCDGTTKYKKMGFFTSSSPNGPYKQTYIVDKGDVLETKSKDCGWFEGIDDYEIRWEEVGTECRGTTKYAKLKAKYYNEDGTEYNNYPKSQYKYEVIEEYSVDCGHIVEYYRWVLTDDVKCFECNG